MTDESKNLHDVEMNEVNGGRGPIGGNTEDVWKLWNKPDTTVICPHCHAMSNEGHIFYKEGAYGLDATRRYWCNFCGYKFVGDGLITGKGGDW